MKKFLIFFIFFGTYLVSSELEKAKNQLNRIIAWSAMYTQSVVPNALPDITLINKYSQLETQLWTSEKRELRSKFFSAHEKLHPYLIEYSDCDHKDAIISSLQFKIFLLKSIINNDEGVLDKVINFCDQVDNINI